MIKKIELKHGESVSGKVLGFESYANTRTGQVKSRLVIDDGDVIIKLKFTIDNGYSKELEQLQEGMVVQVSNMFGYLRVKLDK